MSNDTTPFYISPPMTTQRYAELQGISEETLKKQISRGYVSTIKVGKRRLVNTYAEAAKCIEDTTGGDTK